MKRFLPALFCLAFALILLAFSTASPNKKMNTYPNLPAPIAKEKMIITSAGQAPESPILQAIAENLNLEADYRPRALATDLYEYNSVVVVVGFSNNGLAQTVRNEKQELDRIKDFMREAEANSLPVILVDLSGSLREDQRTWDLIDSIIPYTTYYIGLSQSKQLEKLKSRVKEFHIPVTLVKRMEEIEVPFNSAFR